MDASVPPDRTRVVVVDDDPDARYIARFVLEADGRFIVAAEAATVEEALVVVEASAPDLVVTDLVIGAQRLDAIALFKATATGPKVVVMSAYDRDQAGRLAAEAGADLFVEKTDIIELPDILASFFG